MTNDNDNDINVTVVNGLDTMDLVLQVSSKAGSKLVVFPAWGVANRAGADRNLSHEAWEELKREARDFAFTRGL